MPDILADHAEHTGRGLMPGNLNDPRKIGEWLADPRDDSLTRGTEKIKVEPRTMRLLMHLAQNPGQVVSQEELLDSVWSGVVVGSASVYQSMSQLRKLLGDTDDPPRYIETVTRKGYRLVAPVAPAVAEPLASATPVPGAAPAIVPVPAARRRQWRGWLAIGGVAAIAVTAAIWRFAPTAYVPPETDTIVVLPFVDLTDGKTEQNFCDGLTEETANWLAQIPTLQVVARTTAFSYRNRDQDVRTIGRELQTSHVLEGTLRRSGNLMRITVQLIDASKGYLLWSNSYNVEVGDVLHVQEEVARAVAGNLQLRMTPDTEGRFASRRSGNAAAQRFYLLARAEAAKIDAPANEEAIKLYRRALEADPNFALAKVWLAHALSNRRYFAEQPVPELMKEIRPLLEDVARTAPQLEELYVVRGQIDLDVGDRDSALRDLRHALEMNPSSRAAASALGYYYLVNAQPRDALTFYTIAAGVDPVVAGFQAYRCLALAHLAQFTAAEPACARARDLAPGSPLPFSVSSDMEAFRGNLPEALRWSDAALEHGSSIAAIYGQRAMWLVALGRIAEADAVYRQAIAADREAAHRNARLLLAAEAAAVERGGSQALASFIRDSGLGESSDPQVLFELVNGALLVRDHAQARKFMDRALASSDLTNAELTDPWYCLKGNSYLLIMAEVLRGSGEARAAQGHLDELASILERLETDGVQTPGLFELKAQLAALRGRPDDAMQALQRAVKLGWRDAWLAEHQPYFDSLRGREDFRALLAAVRASNAEAAARLAPRPAGGKPAAS